MAEEKVWTIKHGVDFWIKKCELGFIVSGDRYGGEVVRAFSTAEGLIEWLSRELGAGPIVWGLTLEIWREMAGIKPEDLLPVPDPSVDQRGYREAIEGNAAFLLRKFVETHLKEAVPKPPPEPKPKKEKKVKEEKRMVVARLGLEEEEEEVKSESQRDTPRPDTRS